MFSLTTPLPLRLSQPPLFAGSKVLKKKRAEKALKHLPDFNGDEPFAAVDIGGNGAKMLLVRKDKNGKIKIHSVRYDVENGRSIGRSGRIDEAAQKILKKAVSGLKRFLARYKVKQENINAAATAGLRSASNSDGMLAMIRKMGVPLRLIDGMEESKLIYSAVLKGEDVAPDEDVIVLEIGGGSTELVFGTGPDSAGVDEKLTRILELGSGRLGLRDPFDPAAVKDIADKVAEAFDPPGVITPEMVEAAAGRRMFIKPRNLEDLNLLFKEDTGKKIFKKPITLELIEDYLSKGGLARIEEEVADDLDALEESKLVTKLVIIREVMKRLDLEAIHLGYCGGMKFALLEEHLKKPSAADDK